MKNITIQSESTDRSTDDVLSWLHYLAPDAIVNKYFDTCEIRKIKIELSNRESLKIALNETAETHDRAYWYRRGRFVFRSADDKHFLNGVEHKIAGEYLTPLLKFINGNIHSNGINKFSDNEIEKLDMLHACVGLSISIPDTLITDNLGDVKKFLEQHGSIICKPAKNPFINTTVGSASIRFSGPTELITRANVDELPETFIACLFQKYIPKKIEIRSFYLGGQFYSMAIFSQSNPKTQIDFRNYDHQKPNRVVPYTLPVSLRNKLQKLMTRLEMSSGSFDLILTPDNKYFFLEVNPIGQFQWVSRNCNYFLEKLIATHLLK